MSNLQMVQIPVLILRSIMMWMRKWWECTSEKCAHKGQIADMISEYVTTSIGYRRGNWDIGNKWWGPASSISSEMLRISLKTSYWFRLFPSPLKMNCTILKLSWSGGNLQRVQNRNLILGCTKMWLRRWWEITSETGAYIGQIAMSGDY